MTLQPGQLLPPQGPSWQGSGQQAGSDFQAWLNRGGLGEGQRDALSGWGGLPQNQYQPSPYTGGGGGGGGGVVPAPVRDFSELDALEAEEIRTALKALTARYQAERVALRGKKGEGRSGGQLGELKLASDYALSQSEKAEKEARASTLQGFANRGTARSGFALKADADVVTEAAVYQAQIIAEYTAARQEILTRLTQGITDEKEAAKAEMLAAIKARYALQRLNF
jgi:hypothetical protein